MSPASWRYALCLPTAAACCCRRGEHPKLTLHLKPGEEALDAAGHLVEALTLKRKEISGETPAEGGTL